jgi:hypothetical protein
VGLYPFCITYNLLNILVNNIPKKEKKGGRLLFIGVIKKVACPLFVGGLQLFFFED